MMGCGLWWRVRCGLYIYIQTTQQHQYPPTPPSIHSLERQLPQMPLHLLARLAHHRPLQPHQQAGDQLRGLLLHTPHELCHGGGRERRGGVAEAVAHLLLLFFFLIKRRRGLFWVWLGVGVGVRGGCLVGGWIEEMGWEGWGDVAEAACPTCCFWFFFLFWGGWVGVGVGGLWVGFCATD
jgi:hypothetical protein